MPHGTPRVKVNFQRANSSRSCKKEGTPPHFRFTSEEATPSLHVSFVPLKKKSAAPKRRARRLLPHHRPAARATSPGKVLISRTQIRERIRVLARQIDRAYPAKPPVVVGLMNGSLFFLVDLLRELPQHYTVECWRVTSYRGKESTHLLSGLNSCRGDFRGRDVLVVDDILDTGLTLSRVRKHLEHLGARDIKVCVLLSKRVKRVVPMRADWSGFAIPNAFVIGYGLDLDGKYRSLPEIRVLNDGDAT